MPDNGRMLLEIRNELIHHPWGASDTISRFTGAKADGKPEAELWFGTHARSASQALTDLGWRPLLEITGRPLPFLTKLLAASSPLSIQVHPDLEQAQRGHARTSGWISTFESPVPKPEMMLALSPTEVLAGFLGQNEIAAILTWAVAAADRSRERSLLALRDRLAQGVPGVLEALYANADLVAAFVCTIAESAAAGNETLRHHQAVVRSLYGVHGSDVGVAIAALLRKWVIPVGGVFLIPPRVVHAYLKGFGVELMAASDNVVRGGLTHKQVCPTDFLQMLDVDGAPQMLASPTPGSVPTKVYELDARGYALKMTLVRVTPDWEATVAVESPSIGVVVEGNPVLQFPGERVRGRAGKAYYLDSSRGPLSVTGQGRVAITTAIEKKGLSNG